MFRKILNKINNFKNKKQKKEQQRQSNLLKYYKIRNAVVNFFEDLQVNADTAELPSFIKADKILLEKIKNQEDLNLYYNKLLIHNETLKAVA